MAKEMLWFRHDTNSRSDEKLIRLQMDHGMTGLGVYWCIIEMLYEQMGSMRLQCERIAFELRTQSEIVQDVLTKYDLFQIKGDEVRSERVTETINQNFVKSKGARKAALTRWKDADALQPHSDRNANAMHKKEEEKKREERRREEKKEDEVSTLSREGTEPTPPTEHTHLPTNAKKTRTKVQGAGARRPTQQEVEEYFVSEGYTREAGAKAWKYYETADWHDAKGNPVRNWKQKMQAVWFKEENRAKPAFGPGSQQSSPVPTEIFTRYSAQTGMYHRPLQE